MECTLEPRNLNVRMEPNPVLPEIHLFEDLPSISNIDNTFIQPMNNSTAPKEKNVRTELAELANFYQERNKARVASHYLSLFPISYEHDVEADLSLPQVLPPYLPPRAKDAKPYTLVLDLDETLIHFEEVIYSL